MIQDQPSAKGATNGVLSRLTQEENSPIERWKKVKKKCAIGTASLGGG